MYGISFSLQPDILEIIVPAAGKLGALGDPSWEAAKTAPAIVVVAGKNKKIEKPVTVVVKQIVSGIFRPRIRKSEYYVIVSDTLEGLGVPVSSSGVGGSSACTEPTIGQKRKGDIAAAGGSKRATLRRPRAVVLSTCMPAVSVGNLIDPTRLRGDNEVEEDKKQKSLVQENVSSSGAAGKGDADQPLIQPTEMNLDYYYHNCFGVRGLNIHASPCNVMQVDVMTDPSLCREALKGFGPPVEAVRLKAGGRESLYHQLALHLVGGSLVRNAVLDE
ncbi:hypothetical protein HanRHA438_Chr05g0222301 [Helianthus annuus]|uniref:Uncharacterized protein n=1 Tax=Helianthus annuus TaxID=4232 RepID=A0A9K3NM61_HELAN|nr:hypothetical protein HanXRQr2_Chr05g0212931 [Helianthus annuus]KAJ0570108.1 hypothetical protein HanHA300_Chr05g0174361 [Helianthus annuus]KAJ0576855.1 hypothetical protein HanIR_Chr05g0229231 [Helianthus annuus]KAJ0584447.1 hypothetical protein HanHA89_Chr05g0188741 [Helianthus annuus]KAJ0747067.1 hypothetical protein HanOQP8_Chr05g0185221 [Helianthus annuus]